MPGIYQIYCLKSSKLYGKAINFPAALVKNEIIIQGEQDDPLAGDRADVRMQAFHLVPGDGLDSGFEQRPALFEQGDANLFDQLTATGHLSGSGELMLGLGENPLQAHKHHIVDDEGLGLKGTAPHVILFKFYDGLTDLGFDLPLCSVHPAPVSS